MLLKCYISFLCLLLSNLALAAEDLSLSEFVRQEQRADDLQQRQENERLSVLTPKPISTKHAFEMLFVNEKQCFVMNHIDVEILNRLNKSMQNKANAVVQDVFDEHFRKIEKRCIGTQSLQNIVRFLQNELMKAGYITSFLSVPEQDLTIGELRIQVRFGQIYKIIKKSKVLSDLQIKTALPFQQGDILRVKDIDQGLENLKNNPKLNVKIDILPANSETSSDELIGYSDIEITAQPYEKLNMGISVDDSGSDRTGKYIANLNVGINNLFSLNDILNINYAHSLDNWKENKNESFAANYNIPFEYFQLAVNFNQYDYEQTVAGFNAPIIYSGSSRQGGVALSKVLDRGTNYKTSLYGKIYRKKNQNFIENIEIGVQRRQTAGWNLGLEHQHYLGNATLDAGIDYRRGTGAFHAIPAPEEQILDIFGNPLPVEGYARAPIWTADIRYIQPFFVANTPVQYRLNWRGQYAPKILVPQDRFYIGGRYSVRGYDGQITLGGDNGHYLQQEFAVNGLIQNSQLYAAIDQGWVNGRNSFEDQRYLMGSVLGLRTQYEGFYLDGFLAYGLIAPKSIAKQLVTGFSLNYSF